MDPETFRFDAHGRWVKMLGWASAGCTYDHDGIQSCWRHDSGYPKIETSLTWRDGHIQAIDSEFEHVALVYQADAVVRVELSWVSTVPGPMHTQVRKIGNVGTRINLSYDPRGRLVREDLARGKNLDWVVTTTYSYDAGGRVATRRNEDETTRFTYRGDGRLVRVDTKELNGFDEAHHNIRRSIELRYDAMGRLIADVDRWGDTVSKRTYEYNCR